jgi:hypothetical protein
MLQPGSKGWINKYFDLVEKGVIDLSIERPKGLGMERFLHLTFGYSGITFGYPSKFLFCGEVDASKWTIDEKLKILLFEAHLFIYLCKNKHKKFKKNLFISSLLTFYGNHNSHSIIKIFTFFIKETNEEKLENILSKRLEIKNNIFESKLWISYLNNVFTYLDVLLFHDYLTARKKGTFSNYAEFAMNALTAVSLSAVSDGLVEDQEKALFKIFLASAHLSDDQKETALERFQGNAGFEDFSEIAHNNWLLKRFLLDISALTIMVNMTSLPKEKDHLKALSTYLSIPLKELDETMVMVGNFVLDNNNKVSYLKTSSSYEKMFSSVSKKWLKILGRNKDKLTIELKQSKELVSLIKKSTTQELTKQEKELVKAQFLDIVKTMPSLAIFMLPGGALLLPLVTKIIPDLIPSAFRNNEIDK